MTPVQQFFSTALPIMVTLVVTIWLASWSQNKRFDDLKSDLNRRFDDMKSDMSRRFDDVNRRFDDVHRGANEMRADLNRRIDELRADMNRRFEEVTVRLGRIETNQANHEYRLVRLEERTCLVRR